MNSATTPDQTVQALPANGQAPDADHQRLLALFHDLFRLEMTLTPGADGYAIAHQPVSVMYAVARTILDHPDSLTHPVR